jgi:hypothetical protein
MTPAVNEATDFAMPNWTQFDSQELRDFSIDIEEVKRAFRSFI